MVKFKRGMYKIMGIEIQGIDKLINKLNKISHIEAKSIINEVAQDLEKSIVSAAKTFSDTEYMYIKKCEPRDYGSSCYVDVGLKNDEVDFDLWRGLWFHNWGFIHWKGGQLVKPHAMWFDNAVTGVQDEATNKIKTKLKQELREFNK